MTASLNSARIRMAIEGSLGMNISNGATHILLFERDQQLTALLTSEFQLAGYECHAARTAVEVFDAIARHPVQMVLVDLAQAAAGRREFWVQLDVQRKGREVQVLTYRCTNLAGYGPEDPDERGRANADIGVDGMLGIMNLVDAVRTHVPASTTGSLSQATKAPLPRGQVPGMSEKAMAMPADAAEITVPLRAVASNNRLMGFAASAAPSRQQPPVVPPQVPSQQPPVAPQQVELPVNTTRTYSDRIRAVIYPSQAVWNPPGRSPLNSPGPVVQPGYSPAPAAQVNAPAQNIDMTMATSPTLRALAGQGTGAGPQARQQASLGTPVASDLPGAASPASFGHDEESSLAQLSRMLHEQQSLYPMQESGFQRAKPEAQAAPINTSSLRASPIQDMPVEQAPGMQTRIAGDSSKQEYRLERPDNSQRAVSAQHPAVSMPVKPSFISPMMSSPPQTPEPAYQDIIQGSPQAYSTSAGEEDHNNSVHPGLVQTAIHGALRRRGSEVNIASDNTLLDIMQSLPPMPSPPPPPAPPVLSGRATRSLGSVLLEGHLVPQNRLEVAQSVQRMLRGVDLNYHLGEILLMFKLLTPDQLLAASLVSYGLISTTQISALGRIRQELHSIGLEYDLENLIILFRILTPDQLREVRASWS
jgi:hypothetical protein